MVMCRYSRQLGRRDYDYSRSRSADQRAMADRSMYTRSHSSDRADFTHLSSRHSAPPSPARTRWLAVNQSKKKPWPTVLAGPWCMMSEFLLGPLRPDHIDSPLLTTYLCLKLWNKLFFLFCMLSHVLIICCFLISFIFQHVCLFVVVHELLSCRRVSSLSEKNYWRICNLQPNCW